jgi:hypothetical protein
LEIEEEIIIINMAIEVQVIHKEEEENKEDINHKTKLDQ